jgi:hypothetical protein
LPTGSMKPYFLTLLIGTIIALSDLFRRSEATRQMHRPVASVSDAVWEELCDETLC